MYDIISNVNLDTAMYITKSTDCKEKKQIKKIIWLLCRQNMFFLLVEIEIKLETSNLTII